VVCTAWTYFVDAHSHLRSAVDSLSGPMSTTIYAARRQIVRTVVRWNAWETSEFYLAPVRGNLRIPGHGCPDERAEG